MKFGLAPTTGSQKCGVFLWKVAKIWPNLRLEIPDELGIDPEFSRLEFQTF